MKSKALIIFLVLWCGLVFSEENKINSLKKQAVYSSKYFDVNRIVCSVHNDGVFARHPISGNSDFKFDDDYLIYTSGLWLAAKVNGEVRASAADFNSDWAGGAVDESGDPFGKEDSTFRVYKISRGDNAATNPDYAEWPVQLGAPTDVQGNPLILGDQTLWCSFTDSYLENREYNQCPPLGAEVHLTVWGWKDIDNVMFLRWEIINKSQQQWDDAYLGVYSDPDVIDASNDLTGSDSTLKFVYCYDGTNWSNEIPFRSVGYQLLESPVIPSPADTAVIFGGYKSGFRNLPVYAPRMEKNFGGSGWNDIPYNELASQNIYNRLRCLNFYGDPAIDPITNLPSTWAFSGDPLTRTGWIDDLPPRDRRMMMSTGPITVAPGDTATMMCAVFPVRNNYRLGNVFDVKQNALALQSALKNGAAIYSSANIATIENYNFSTPISLLNFNDVEELQFTVQFDNSEIYYKGLVLSDRTARYFSFDSNFVDYGKIEYALKKDKQKNLSIGNDPICFLEFDIPQKISKDFVFLEINNTRCKFENKSWTVLNNADCLIKIEKLPPPPRLLKPYNGEFIDDLTVHFEWTKTEGSDPNTYYFKSNLYNSIVEDTSFSYPLINFIRKTDDQGILDWTVVIQGYSQSVLSPDTFQLRFPSRQELNFTQFLYTSQLPHDSEKSEQMRAMVPDENYLYIIQSYQPNPYLPNLNYHFLVVELKDTGWSILSDRLIDAYGDFVIQGKKAFIADYKRLAIYLIGENKMLQPHTSFQLEESISKVEVIDDLLILYGSANNSNPKIAIYQFNDEFTELNKLSELNLTSLHSSIYHTAAKWIIQNHRIYLLFSDWGILTDWGVIDFSDPDSLQIISHVIDTTGASSFLVCDHKMYNSTENGYINIYDISNPENPLLIHSENLGHEYSIINILGDDMFATYGSFIYRFQFQQGQNLKFDGLLEFEYYNPIMTDKFVLDYSLSDNLIDVYKNQITTANKFPGPKGLRSFHLSQNYPNPFNPTTTIRFSIANQSFVSLKIYNILGQEVADLFNSVAVPGGYAVNWDGKDRFGCTVSSGIYFARLNTSEGTKLIKMALVR